MRVTPRYDRGTWQFRARGQTLPLLPTCRPLSCWQAVLVIAENFVCRPSVLVRQCPILLQHRHDSSMPFGGALSMLLPVQLFPQCSFHGARKAVSVQFGKFARQLVGLGVFEVQLLGLLVLVHGRKIRRFLPRLK